MDGFCKEFGVSKEGIKDNRNLKADLLKKFEELKVEAGFNSLERIGGVVIDVKDW